MEPTQGLLILRHPCLGSQTFDTDRFRWALSSKGGVRTSRPFIRVSTPHSQQKLQTEWQYRQKLLLHTPELRDPQALRTFQVKSIRRNYPVAFPLPPLRCFHMPILPRNVTRMDSSGIPASFRKSIAPQSENFREAGRPFGEAGKCPKT